MILEEAIKHCLEKAGQCGTACEKEHKQLADWLKELKDIKERQASVSSGDTQQIMVWDIESSAKACINFCDGCLFVSIAGDRQYDYKIEPITISMLAHAYQLHCQEIEKMRHKTRK